MAITITDEMVKKASVLVAELDKFCYNPFMYSEEIKESYEKVYNWYDQELKIKRLCEGNIGMISDAYILYAIAKLHVATRADICTFLQTYHNVYKDLHITDVSDESSLKSCMKRLEKSGLVFKHCYSYQITEKMEKSVSLYTISRSNVDLMNAILEKNVKCMPYLQAKQLYQIIALAASSHTCSVVMSKAPNFYEIGDGEYHSKFIGGFSVAQEIILKEKDGRKTFVGFVPGFYDTDNAYQTPTDVSNQRIHYMNIIRNYIELNHTAMKDGYIVITLKDKKNFDVFIKMVETSGILSPVLSHVYLTGYGILEHGKASECLQVYKRQSGECVVYAKNPTFL